jgi:hypothetical protein
MSAQSSCDALRSSDLRIRRLARETTGTTAIPPDDIRPIRCATGLAAMVRSAISCLSTSAGSSKQNGVVHLLQSNGKDNRGT